LGGGGGGGGGVNNEIGLPSNTPHSPTSSPPGGH
jgi:hypothetical protein